MLCFNRIDFAGIPSYIELPCFNFIFVFILFFIFTYFNFILIYLIFPYGSYGPPYSCD